MELSYEEWYNYFYFTTNETMSVYGFMSEILTKAIAGVFDMNYCEKGRWWYSDWEGNRRKVISLSRPYVLTNICWGWDYDYIPHMANSGKISYARTEKSFAIHVGDYYINHIDYEPDKMTEVESLNLRRKYSFPAWTNDEQAAKEYMYTVAMKNIPFMTEWFERTKTDEDTLAELDRQLAVYSPFSSRSEAYAKAFILAKNNRLNEAVELISNKYYSNGYCNEKILAKLKGLAENNDN